MLIKMYSSLFVLNKFTLIYTIKNSNIITLKFIYSQPPINMEVYAVFYQRIQKQILNFYCTKVLLVVDRAKVKDEGFFQEVYNT